MNPSTPRLPQLSAGIAAIALAIAPAAIAQTADVSTQPSAPRPANTLRNQATYQFEGTNLQQGCAQTPAGCAPITRTSWTGLVSNSIDTTYQGLLVDPLGKVTGCAGELLPDYQGFSVTLYEADPADPTGASFSRPVPLTQTEVPNNPNNQIPEGLNPNANNSNPFSFTNSDRGTYNFMLDLNQGQLNPGRAYILVLNPPRDSNYSQRRVRLEIGSRTGAVVNYTARSLDGKPISTTDNQTTVTGTITVQDAAQTGLSLSVLSLGASICQDQEIKITKTGDRAAAEPGDTVIYRLSVRNLASATVNKLTITDVLPVGFRLRPNSGRAEFKGVSVPVSTQQAGRTVTFTFDPNFTLPAASSTNATNSDVINLAYAATLSPDAIRGDGQNIASVLGQRQDNLRPVQDGPASHRLRIRNGIVSDCGTLVGRVFEDKNFDGEQQPDEPGIPNAVVIMDDGNRITTDLNGLFSVANVLPGYRTGALDLTSVPGYTLARNLKFSERNSQSRAVHLSPGSLMRMNFAVTRSGEVANLKPAPNSAPIPAPAPASEPTSEPASTSEPSLTSDPASTPAGGK
jgi:uncharacterized repeat protein (TIGR01451 family)